MVEMSENGIPDVFEPVGSGRRGLRGWEEGVGAVFEANVSEEIQPGDVVGFISADISIAFSNRDIESPANDTNTTSSNEIIGLVSHRRLVIKHINYWFSKSHPQRLVQW